MKNTYLLYACMSLCMNACMNSYAFGMGYYNFSVFGDSYEGCLENLRKVLERCQKKNLVLNWEKCHHSIEKRNRGGQGQSRVDL